MDEETHQIIAQSITALVRHGLTILSGVLVTSGFLQQSQSLNFTEIGIGVVSAVVALGWSVMNKKALVQAAR
jgi:hypothetical protein